jgi:hypothetical protein
VNKVCSYLACDVESRTALYYNYNTYKYNCQYVDWSRVVGVWQTDNGCGSSKTRDGTNGCMMCSARNGNKGPGRQWTCRLISGTLKADRTGEADRSILAIKSSALSGY